MSKYAYGYCGTPCGLCGGFPGRKPGKAWAFRERVQEVLS